MEVEPAYSCPLGECLMADARGYLKLSYGFPEHPKIEEAGGDAAWLHVCALAYCSRNLTDGFFPMNVIGRLSDRDNPKQLASTLLDVGLWHDADNNCDRCPAVPSGKYLIHDFLEHQTSAERVREISEKRSIAGQRGGRAKAAALNGSSKLPSKLPSKSLADVDVDVDVEGGGAQSAADTTARKRAAPPRGSRIPENFKVTPEMRAWYDQKIGPHVDGRTETEKFRNYWAAKTGRDAVKLDWEATWRNWMLKASEGYR